MAALERFIQVIGKPWKISHVFQKRKERKEDSHGREHDGDHPGDDPIDPEDQHAMEPFGRMKPSGQCGQQVLKPKEKGGKRL